MIIKLKSVVIENNNYYLLKDVFNLTTLNTYIPERLLKNVPSSEIKMQHRKKARGGISKRKYIYVTQKGAMQILNKNKPNKPRRLSLKEMETLAREYGVNYGFIQAHLYAGDLKKQLEYIAKYHKKRTIVKSYDCRDFNKTKLYSY